MRAKIRLQIKRSEKSKKSELKKWDVSTLYKNEVKEEFIKEVTANIQHIQLEEGEDVNEICNKLKTE